jgi:DNA repair exonuclease SbcCD ATPase subunit
MKHPRREEWVPFVFGEAEPEQRQQLEEHLKQCADCSAEISQWQKSLRRMDAWQVPPRQKVRRSGAQPLAWAAAAVLMLGIGLAAGQWSMASTRASMRMEMSRLESQMTELKKQTAVQTRTAPADSAFAETIKELQTALANMATEREEDRQHLIAMIEELSTKHEEGLVSLRKDLETVASHADDELQAARSRLTELSSVGSTASRLVEGE